MFFWERVVVFNGLNKYFVYKSVYDTETHYQQLRDLFIDFDID